MQISINYSGKKIKLDVKRTGFFSKGTGLMFKSRNTDNLLFEFNNIVKNSLTSFFVFFPFLVAWLDKDNRVLDFRLVNPFNLSVRPNKPYIKFIEIPVNSKNSKLIEFFVGGRKV